MIDFLGILLFIVISIALIGIIMSLILWLITIGMDFYRIITEKKTRY